MTKNQIQERIEDCAYGMGTAQDARSYNYFKSRIEYWQGELKKLTTS